jgi:hypothetical protein
MRKIFTLAFVLSCLLMLFVGTAVEAGTPCAGSPDSRLTVGQPGYVAQRFSSLRSAPAGPVIRVIYSPATFTVLEGPVCAGYGPLAFYRVDYGGGVTGWASEGEVYSIYGSNQYWLAPGLPTTVTPTVTPTVAPVTPTPSPTVCAGSLATRLTVGNRGQIAQRFSSLRSAAGGPVIRVVYAPAQFTVLAGPVCSGGVQFFNIDYGGGLTGWAAESEVYSIYGFNQYWLAPAA